MPEIPTPKSAAEDLTKLAKDVLYVTVGLGVIAVQKVQVRRREVREQLGDPKAQFKSITKLFEERVKVVEERLEGVDRRFEALLDQFEERLPEQARGVAQQARTAAKEARTQARSLVGRGAA
jgi:ElaB/YqjD/DUF883 family membrane-anchored ribosome-binding protein